jgi:hypothetical protein
MNWVPVAPVQICPKSARILILMRVLLAKPVPTFAERALPAGYFGLNDTPIARS